MEKLIITRDAILSSEFTEALLGELQTTLLSSKIRRQIMA